LTIRLSVLAPHINETNYDKHAHEVKVVRFGIADLAGSERTDKTLASGDRFIYSYIYIYMYFWSVYIKINKIK